MPGVKWKRKKKVIFKIVVVGNEFLFENIHLGNKSRFIQRKKDNVFLLGEIFCITIECLLAFLDKNNCAEITSRMTWRTSILHWGNGVKPAKRNHRVLSTKFPGYNQCVNTVDQDKRSLLLLSNLVANCIHMISQRVWLHMWSMPTSPKVRFVRESFPKLFWRSWSVPPALLVCLEDPFFTFRIRKKQKSCHFGLCNSVPADGTIVCVSQQLDWCFVGFPFAIWILTHNAINQTREQICFFFSKKETHFQF